MFQSIRSIKTTRVRSKRTAASLIEMIVTCVLLGTVLVSIVPVMGWVSAERHAADERQFALLQATNLMESIGRISWAELNDDSLGRLQLTEETQVYLNSSSLDIQLNQLDGPPMAKRVDIKISWKDRKGRPMLPFELSAWFHNTEAKSQ